MRKSKFPLQSTFTLRRPSNFHHTMIYQIFLPPPFYSIKASINSPRIHSLCHMSFLPLTQVIFCENKILQKCKHFSFTVFLSCFLLQQNFCVWEIMQLLEQHKKATDDDDKASIIQFSFLSFVKNLKILPRLRYLNSRLMQSLK